MRKPNSMTPAQRVRAVSNRMGKSFLRRLDEGKLLNRATSTKNTRRYVTVTGKLA